MQNSQTVLNNNGWKEYQLKDCVDILDGQRVPINSNDRSKRIGEVPYYGATGQVGWINDYIFDEELVLLGEDGAPFLDKSKPIAYIINGKSWVNNHAHVLRARKDISNNRFIKYYLDYFDFSDYVAGTTRLKLTQSAMKTIPIKLPDVTTQNKIADLLNNQIISIHKTASKLTSAKNQLNNFRQAILTAAITGKLTEDWRKKQLSTIKDLNSVWANKALGELCEKGKGISYGVIKLGEHIEDGTPCLRTSNVRWLNFELNGLKRISPTLSSSYSRTILMGGEVLVNVRGTLGGVVAVPTEMKGWNVSREVAVVPVDKSKVFPDFIAYYIGSTVSQYWLANVQKGVAYTGINLEDLRNLPIEIPILEEQKEIVKRVKSYFELADKVEKQIEAAEAKVSKLTQAVLAKTFNN